VGIKITRKISGWGKKGRPFSKAEYEKSYIKSSFRGGYTKYLQNYAYLSKKKNFRKTYGL